MVTLPVFYEMHIRLRESTDRKKAARLQTYEKLHPILRVPFVHVARHGYGGAAALPTGLHQHG